MESDGEENKSTIKSTSTDDGLNKRLSSSVPPPLNRISSTSPRIRIKTKEIERGVAWRTIPSVIETQSLTDEKKELNDLNSRLEMLLNLLKSKKAENDKLENEIKNYKNNFKTTSKVINSSELGSELTKARKDLNDLSNDSTIKKIRLARSLHDLDQLKERLKNETNLQSNDKIRINTLETELEETFKEINSLRERFNTKEEILKKIMEKNWNLIDDYHKLADGLDDAIKERVFIELDIQSLIEKRNFEIELFKLMKAELEKLYLIDGDGKKLIDFEKFYENELKNIKDKIRDDFIKINEYNYDNYKFEYETRYSKIVEETEIQDAANSAAIRAHEEEALRGLNAEYLQNQIEIQELTNRESNLKKILDELLEKYKLLKVNNESNKNKRDGEIGELEESLRQIKNDSWQMLNTSKELDREIAIFDRLLSERFNQYITGMNTEVVLPEFNLNEYKNTVTSEFTIVNNSKKPVEKHHEDEEESRYERYIPNDDNFNRKDKFIINRITLIDQELNELRKHQDEFEKRRRERVKREEEERQRRLKEEEEERERQRKLREQQELERQRKLKEEAEERERERLRRKREEEEAEKERIRRLQEQLELERQQRLREEEERERQRKLREQQELERQRMLKEEEERQRKRKLKEEQEEQERLRKLREQQELERQRKLKEEAEERERERLRREEEEEQERLRKLREQQEQERKRKLKEAEDERKRIEEYEIKIRLEREENERKLRLQQEKEKEEEEAKRKLKELEEIEMTISFESEKTVQKHVKILKPGRVQIGERAETYEVEARPSTHIEKYQFEQRVQLEYDDIENKRRQQKEEEFQAKLKLLDKHAIDDKDAIMIPIEKEKHKYQLDIHETDNNISKINDSKIVITKPAGKLQVETGQFIFEYGQFKINREKEETRMKQENERKRQLQLEEEKRLKEIEIYNNKQKQLEKEKAEYELRIQREQEEARKLLILLEEEKRLKQLEKEKAEYEQKLKRQEQENQYYIYKQQQQQQQQQFQQQQKYDEEQRRLRILHEEEERRLKQIEETKTVVKTNETIETRKQKTRTGFIENYVDHCISSNSGRKHVLILNNQLANKIKKDNKDKLSKYALKHKANRYVSGAIGILETSVNGEYIVLENLSSSKTVNLNGWYIHRYVPDQSINVIYKFNVDVWLKNGDKLRVWCKNSSHKLVSTLEYFDIIAEEIEHWGVYSKYSVTKLINPEGIDKAVLTQTLLRLATTSNNITMLKPPIKQETIEYQNVQTTTTTTTTTNTLNQYSNNKQQQINYI